MRMARTASGRRPLLMALTLALAALGCARGQRPSLLLVTIDTTRVDHLGAYGYERATSPSIDALAAESVRFDRAYAHVPITLPSHTGMMTGTVPLFHGVRDNGRFTVRPGLVTLAEIAVDAGYRTAAFVSAFVLDSRYGLDQGFELYDDEYSADWSEEDIRDARIYNTMVTERRADQTTDRALEWLSAVGDGPFFAWVHYYDPHQRYRPPAPWDAMFGGDPYDGEIAFMDSQIGRLFAELRRQGRWEDTLVVLTSDHGESLGQHGEPTHAVLTYDSTMRVALLVRAQAAAGIAPGVDPRTVSHRDLLPTVTRLLDLPTPRQVQGQALLPAGGEERRRDRPIYFECNLPRFGYGWESLFGVRTDGWKYIHGPARELYDLAADPAELYNLAPREAERRERFERLLFRVVGDESAPPEELGRTEALDSDARSKLAALGYVSGGAVAPSELTPRAPTGRRDPRAGLVFLGDYFAASAMAGRGQLEQAATVYEDVLLQLDPGNPAFWTNLGDLRRRLGDREAAFEAYRRAQAVDPANASILVELGRLEMDQGRFDAAEELLRAALALEPADLAAAYSLGRVASERGEQETAIERYAAALALDESHRDSRLQLALAYGRSGRLEEARRELVALLERSPFSAQVHYNLAIVQLRTDRPAEAEASLERALRYRSAYPEAEMALGLAQLRTGRPEAARETFERILERYPGSEMADRARRSLAGLDQPVG